MVFGRIEFVFVDAADCARELERLALPVYNYYTRVVFEVEDLQREKL